jgi:hypothetical protein
MPEPVGDLHETEESDDHVEDLHAVGTTRTYTDTSEIPKYCPATRTTDVAVDGTDNLASRIDRTAGFKKLTTFAREPCSPPTDKTIPILFPVPMGTKLRTQDWEIHVVVKNEVL